MGSEIERIDEQARVSDLSAATASHEAPKLLFVRPTLPRRLLLEGAERSEVTLGVHDLFHRGGAESADQLVLEVCDAHVKTQLFHVDPCEIRAQAGPLETTLELALLGGVTETGQSDVRTSRAEQIQEVSDRLRASNRHDGDALRVKISTMALSEGFERELVTDSFDEYDSS
ncbi:MAG: hypothetical protein H0W90_11230 [Actinobacteria bacterium]|nr:hypothetical protein [Actinomycetota bacterium]